MLPVLFALTLFGQANLPDVSSDEAQWMLTSAVRTRPAGGFIGLEALFPTGTDTRAGAYLNYYYYWADMGARLDYTYLGGFLVADVWAGVEPGDFIRAGQSGDDRTPGLRGVLRGRLTLNYRTGDLWLYNRFTAEGRVRTFAERDPFRDAILDSELSIEEAFAPLWAVARWGERSILWLYAEVTVAAEVQFGLLDLRPSAGVILEELASGLTINLDLYYGLREDSRVEGWGGLMFMWWRF